MKAIHVVLIFVFILFVNCNSVKNKSEKAALSYFYGFFENDGGYLISSHSGKDKGEKIASKKAYLGLNNNWSFYDEKINLIHLGNYEYFIRYECIFKRSKPEQFCTIEESFFSDPETSYDPVPLKKLVNIYSIENEERKEVKRQTLWEGDFTFYLKSHKRL